MSDAPANHGAFVAKAGSGQAQPVVQIVQISAAGVPQLDVLQVRPDAFVRIELWRVAGQLLEAQPFGSTLRQELLNRPTAMDGRAIPDHQHLARQAAKEVAEELHYVWTAEGMVLDLEQQAAGRGDATDHRQMVMTEWETQRGRVAAWGKAAHRGGQ